MVERKFLFLSWYETTNDMTSYEDCLNFAKDVPGSTIYKEMYDPEGWFDFAPEKVWEN